MTSLIVSAEHVSTFTNTAAAPTPGQPRRTPARAHPGTSADRDRLTTCNGNGQTAAVGSDG